MQGVLLTGTWWSTAGLDDGPFVPFASDCEPIQLVILDSDVRNLSSDTTKDVYSFKSNLARNQVPLDVGKLMKAKHLSFFVSYEAHGARIEVSGTVAGVGDRKLLPLLGFHVDANEVFQSIALLVDAAKTKEMLPYQESGHIAPLGEMTIRLVPEMDLFPVACLGVEFENLLRTEADLKCPVEAKTSKEVVQLVVIHTGAESEYTLDFMKASLCPWLHDSVLSIAP